MNPRQVELVQASFEKANRIGPHVAATFYAELFSLDPGLRALFSGDMIAQGQKLMHTLAYVVEGLKEPQIIGPAVRTLAVRHLNYGVEERHYTLVGTALLRTLRHELGQDFTPEVREAWAGAYTWLANTMREAAYGQSAVRAAR